MSISAILLVAFTAGTAIRGGLNFGIDFVGGVKIIADFPSDVNEPKIRELLSEFEPVVQQIGDEALNEYIISVKLPEGAEAEQQSRAVKSALEQDFPGVVFKSIENVGPAIGNILKRDALKALFIAMILMAIYLAFRFEIKYSVGTLAAVVHDILITLAFCGIMGIEINVPVIAAFLTIFGYSVNDTIVIFDRIRENVQGRSKMTFHDVINKSVSQSVNRTLLTSLTTLFAISALYFLGGKVLNEFAQVLLLGIFVGTYSSIYIASPVLLMWERARSS
jgi:preprotein translocase subunit SecF